MSTPTATPKPIEQFVEEWIVKVKMVLKSTKMVHAANEFKSASDYDTYCKAARAAGLLVLKSSDNKPYPKTIFTIALYATNQMVLFPRCLEPDSPNHLVAELKDVVDNMKEDKMCYFLIAISSPNVDAAKQCIAAARAVYGDRLMTSSMPNLAKGADVDAIEWFLGVSNKWSHAQVQKTNEQKK